MPFDLSCVISQDDASLSSDVVACIHRRFRHGAWTTRAGPDIISVNPVGAVIDKTAAVANGQDDEGDLSVKAASGEWARVCRRRAKAKTIEGEGEGKGEEEEDKVVVVVTGVSGSGKSATVRRCLEHVADPSSEFMSKLGPIDVVLSALGHAATPANEDSSRFGKLIMIYPSGRCKLETYLLERGRVTYQNPNEGGFHIMASLASLASPLLPPDSRHVWSEKAWCRTLASVIEKGNGSLVYLSDVARLDSIQKTTERVDAFHHALQDLGWTSHDIDTLFNWLCGILVLGNDPHAAARLWQISEADLDRVIMTLATGVTRSAARQAEAKAGIARMMYVALWDNVMERINTALGGNEAESSESGGWIAFLDLFGPENFELNSFEQYCINWTNETLHESLVSNFIKFLEQTYAGQGLSLDIAAAGTCASSHVDDNTRADAPTRSRDNCLRALDGKTDSINCVLQDVTVLPAAGDGVDLDTTLADRLRKVFPPAHKWRPNVAAVEMSSAPARLLTIHHEIQTCVYDLTGWISKNAETIDQRFIRLWDKQGAAMIAEAVRRLTSMTNGSGSGNRTSIILQQRRSLARLGKTLEGARLLHIACVRRDNARVRSGPDQGWDTIHLWDQLVGCGLVASLKIARRYPTIPMSLTESRDAYGPLLGDNQELNVWMASLCDDMAGDKFISGTDRILLSAGFKAKLDRLREAYLLEERRRQAAKQAERDKEAERKKEEDNDKAQRLDERHAEKATKQGAEEAAERVAKAMLLHDWDDDGAGDVTMLDLNMSMLDESVDMSIEDLEPRREGVSVQARTLTPSRSDAECILYALTYFVAHAPDHLFRGIDIGAIFKSRTARALRTGVIGSSIVGGKGSEGMVDDLVGALLGRMVITSPQASDMTSTLVNHFRPALELWSQAAMVASSSISTASAISPAIPDVDTNAGADALVKALCETIVPALMAATTDKVDEMYGRRVSSTDAEHRDEDEALRTELGEALIVHLSDLYALFGVETPATHAGATTNVGVAMSALRKKVHLPLFLHVVHEAIGLTERPIPVSYSHSPETVQKSLVKHLQNYAKLRGLVLSAADQAWLDARLTGKHRVVPPCCTTWAGWHTIVSDITTIYAGVSFNPNQMRKGLPVLHRLGRADHIDYWHKLSTATAEARGMYTRGWQLIAAE